MSRWIVRTETSNARASSLALTRPRACSSIRIERRRLANIFRGYPKYMTHDVMFMVLHRRAQPKRSWLMKVVAILLATTLICGPTAVVAPTFATGETMTDHAHDFDFLI